MPLFDYECPKCSKQVEVLSGKEVMPPRCDCGTTMERLMTGLRYVKVWNYEPLADAAASARRCGVDWD